MFQIGYNGFNRWKRHGAQVITYSIDCSDNIWRTAQLIKHLLPSLVTVRIAGDAR